MPPPLDLTPDDGPGLQAIPSPVASSQGFHAADFADRGIVRSVASTSVGLDAHTPDAPLLTLGGGATGAVHGGHAILSGTAAPASQVALSIDGVARGNALAGADGRWVLGLDLAAGTYVATAIAMDGAGHASAPSTALTFSVSDSAAGDVPGDASTRAQLPIGASVQDNIEAFGDHDWYKVTLDAKTLYQFTLAASESNAGTLVMPGSGRYENYLRVWDAQDMSGPVQAGWSLAGSPAPSTIRFEPTHAGDYYLDVGSSFSTGSYTLGATLLAHDDHAGDTAHATALPAHVKVEGAIDFPGDVDQFAVTLRAGVTYDITLDSDGAAYGTVLRGLTTSVRTNAIVSGGASNWTGTVKMSITPTVDGTYYVAASGGGGDTVPYHIWLTESRDDYAANTGTTGSVQIGTLAHGTLESGADADWFKATLSAGQSYLLQAVGAKGTPFNVVPFDGAGKPAVDGAFVAGSNATLWTPATSGDYYFQVSGATAPGAYTLSMTLPAADDFGAGAASAGTLTAARVIGALEKPGDVDWFKVALTAGTDYTFLLDAGDGGAKSQLSGPLQLLDASGQQFAVADAGKLNGVNQLAFHATTTGDYYLAVSDSIWRGIGTYGVSMYAGSRDTLSADAHTSASLSPGGVLTGTIDVGGDVDWVRVDMQAGHTYQFALTGADARGGTLPSTTPLLGLVDEHGMAQAVADHAAGRDGTIDYRATADVTYYLAVSASGGAVGTYTLKAMNDATPYVDTLPPLLANAVLPTTAQPLDRNVAMTFSFDEAIAPGSGAITLRLANGDVVQRFNAADGIGGGNTASAGHASSLTLTSALLKTGTDYVLTFDPGSIVDTSNHPFAGVSLPFHTSDTLFREGSAGNDVLDARVVDEVIDGKGGRDTVVFADASANYMISRTGSMTLVDKLWNTASHHDLIGIDRLVFSDRAIAYDTDGSAGQAFRLYQAAFDRAPDLDGLGYWIRQLDQGAALVDVTDAFVHSAEFTTLYGAASPDADFVTSLYHNVLHRLPDAPGAAYWNTRLHDGASRATVLMEFSESTENQAALIGQITKGIVYHPYA